METICPQSIYSYIHRLFSDGAVPYVPSGVQEHSPLGEVVRTVVADKDAAPSQAWRHRFKTTGIEAGIEAGIEHRILDAIQGHRPRNVRGDHQDASSGHREAALTPSRMERGQYPLLEVPVCE